MVRDGHLRRGSLGAGAGLALAGVLATAGCQADLALPPGAELACGPGTPCPSGHACNEVVRRCVAVGGGDRRAPEVVGGSVRIEPAVARIGQTVEVGLGVDEPLALSPKVTLELPEPLLVPATAEGGRAFSLSYRPSGDEPQATPVTLTARLVDGSGNEARGIALGSVRFDFAPPVPSPPRVLDPRHPGRGGTGRVEVVLDEALPRPPAVVTGTGSPLAFEPGAPVPAYRYAWTVGPDEVEGPVGPEVAAVDAAGNEGLSSLADAFVLDFTPPALAEAPAVSRAAVRAGATVAVGLEVDEPLARDPEVRLRPAVGGRDRVAGRTRPVRAGSGRRPAAAGSAQHPYVVALRRTPSAPWPGGVGAGGAGVASAGAGAQAVASPVGPGGVRRAT